MRVRHRQGLRELVGGRQNSDGSGTTGEIDESCCLLVRLQGGISSKRSEVGMPRTHLAILLEPMNGTMKLVEVKKLVEAPHTTFCNFAGIIDVKAINRRVEASSSATGEPIEILNAQQFQGLLEQGVVIQSEKVGSTEITVAGHQLGEKRELRCDLAGRLRLRSITHS